MVDNKQLDAALVHCQAKVAKAIEELQAAIGAGFDIDVSTTWLDISTLDGGHHAWPRVRVTVSRSSP